MTKDQTPAAALQNNVSETVKAALTGYPAALSGVRVDEAHVYVMLDVDPTAGTALEDCRQHVESIIAPLAAGRQVMVVMTAEKTAPPKIESRKKNAGGFSHRISSKPVAPDVKYMIAVASGKGGVGKSTVAANLALAFAALGKKTGLLDADIYGASQPVMMGLREKPALDAAEMIVPPVAHGIKVMSMGFFVAAQSPVIWRGPMVHAAIQQLLRDVAWGELDVLVIDLPPGTGDAQLSLAQYVPLAGAVIVSTPQDVALDEALKGMRMFEKTNVPVLGIVENMSYHRCSDCGAQDDIFGHGGARQAAAAHQVDFLGEIPVERILREQADKGTPLVAAVPHHPVAQTFMNMASRIWIGLPAVAARDTA